MVDAHGQALPLRENVRRSVRPPPFRRSREPGSAPQLAAGRAVPVGESVRRSVRPPPFRRWNEPGLARLLARGDPGRDLRVQRVERNGALTEHRAVEGAKVELVPKLLLSAGAELADLELPDLVGERLAGV